MKEIKNTNNKTESEIDLKKNNLEKNDLKKNLETDLESDEKANAQTQVADLEIIEQTPTSAIRYFYPKDQNPPIYLAYGFRPVFLLLAPYMIINIGLWALFWMNFLPISFFEDPIEWHIYEMVYGVGTAGIIAFLLTAIPEMFTGVMPLVGKRLGVLVGIWILGRISFWLMDFIGVYLVAIINVIPLIIVAHYAFRPVILDKAQKHASIGYLLLILIFLQFYFFASKFELVDAYSTDILKMSIGAFMCLIIVAIRRVKTEAINQRLEDEGVEEVLLLRPPRYNLAVFAVALYTLGEFYFPENRALGWLGFAAGAAVLGILAELKMKDNFILFEPFVIYFASIMISMGLGYILMGYTYFNPDFGGINHFRHFLTIGAFGMTFFMVFVVVTYIHTGRRLRNTWSISLGVILLFIAGILRAILGFFPDISMVFYAVSAVLWMSAFGLYFFNYYRFLLRPRADNLPG